MGSGRRSKEFADQAIGGPGIQPSGGTDKSTDSAKPLGSWGCIGFGDRYY